MVKITPTTIKVKICGITNLQDALNSVDAGCDAIGFLLYKNSPRYISPEKARRIIAHLPKEVVKIGVFVNAREKTIRRVVRLCGFNMVQFHGNESPEFCSRFYDYKTIKVFRVKDTLDVKKVLKYKTFAYLFDTLTKSKIGGTGETFDWRLIRHAGDIRRPIFLSGGLREKNVRDAIEKVHPAWVDVCTSVEILPGKKDARKVREFIKAAKK